MLHRLTGDRYPVYWLEANSQEEKSAAPPEKLFRLATVAYSSSQTSFTELAVGSLALQAAQQDATQAGQHRAPAGKTGLLLKNLKPYLKVSLPYYSSQTSTEEPLLQWSSQQQVPLVWCQHALQMLLSTFSSASENFAGETSGSAPSLTCAAFNLSSADFRAALRQLAGVVIGYPTNWSDTYSFNVREAVLAAKLVSQPEQILFVEDAIATVLATLQEINSEAVTSSNRGFQKPISQKTARGNTLAINAGATTTELALVNLPSDLKDLNYSDFSVRSLSYAGNAIDQDIVCQLLYPQWVERRASNTTATNQSVGEDLDLKELNLPLPGAVDLPTRYPLQQHLQNSSLGRNLLEAANQLKVILQHQDRFTFELSGKQWTVLRRDLENKVFLPYIQRLNRELNVLLSQTGTVVQAVNQVICTGGTASLPAIARWLRQKLPNATIVQDPYPLKGGKRRSTTPEKRPVTCSRVAYGLAILPLYPQVIDIPRQQYNDYFLLLELLRAFPEQPLPVGGIMQVLERRGINTHACHLHILALLEGHLPPGLVPTEIDASLLASSSRNHPDYQALMAAPLFKKQGQTYLPNLKQRDRLQQHLEAVMLNTYQTLEEPFIFNLSRYT